jgi:glycosyltransferase involved in cell wall biosynthesis
MNKLVSIIVPCYNQSIYLDEALQSVLEQTYNDWECIIVDDGSTDNTKQIAANWIEKDNRFIYHYKENQGLCSARNTGINISKGIYILPLDADDKISKEYIELAVVEFQKNENLKVVYCNARKFGKINSNWILPIFSIQNLAISNMIFCTAIYKKSDWTKIGGYDVNMKYGLEDWEFWISLLKNGGDVLKLNHLGFFYRTKENSMVTNLNDEKSQLMYDYISIKHVDFFVKNLGSFKILISKINKNEKNLKNTKFIINLVWKKIFRFNLFSNLN